MCQALRGRVRGHSLSELLHRSCDITGLITWFLKIRKTEAQTDQVTCPRPHRFLEDLGSEPSAASLRNPRPPCWCQTNLSHSSCQQQWRGHSFTKTCLDGVHCYSSWGAQTQCGERRRGSPEVGHETAIWPRAANCQVLSAGTGHKEWTTEGWARRNLSFQAQLLHRRWWRFLLGACSTRFLTALSYVFQTEHLCREGAPTAHTWGLNSRRHS